jgi:transcriptional regulator with PAS, ATPase and Fis domain
VLSEQLSALPAAETGDVFISPDPAVRKIYATAEAAAPSDVTILITGESGTGKEVLARHVHSVSSRAAGPFVAVNCAAIPAPLFESELFGYEKGAFTGAARTTMGKIESAHGGTLFLDEIGELDMALQPKLLRFLQDRIFYRVGGVRGIDADVRVVAASNRDLEGAVRQRKFREDLWYRLNVMRFDLPPLRDRPAEIPALARFLVARCATRLRRDVRGLSAPAELLLQEYDWPGNIRELENAIERGVLLAKGAILAPSDFAHLKSRARSTEPDIAPMAEIERQHILAALKRYGWNQARAAEALQLHRNTLRNKIQEYQLRQEAD